MEKLTPIEKNYLLFLVMQELAILEGKVSDSEVSDSKRFINNIKKKLRS